MKKMLLLLLALFALSACATKPTQVTTTPDPNATSTGAGPACPVACKFMHCPSPAGPMLNCCPATNAPC
jgi:hypothetical protein